MLRNPLVTVIIPAYNAEKYIDRTIQSVINQTYQNIEIIVVDDSSTDDTIKKIYSFSDNYKNVKCISLEFNSGGPATPRNHGIQLSQGELIAFLDSDDIWHPKKLEIQVHLLMDSGSAAICSGCADFSDDSSIVFAPARMIETEFVTYSQVKVKSLIPLSTLLIKKETIGNLQFNSDKSVSGREDYLFTLDYLKVYKSILKVKYPLMYYRKHAAQISRNKFKMLLRQYVVLNSHLTLVNNPIKQAVILSLLASHVLLSIYYRLLLKRM